MTISDPRKRKTQQDYAVIEDMYTKDFENDREHFELVDKAILLLKKNNLTGLPVFDMGSGPGEITDYLLENGFTNITAVDFAEPFCKVIKTKHHEKVNVVCEDMLHTVQNRPSDSVAAYFFNYSLMHIPVEEGAELLANVSRTLLPNGICMISCFKGTFKGMEQEPYQSQNDARLSHSERLETYMQYFTEDELTEILHQAGLEVVSMETYDIRSLNGETPAPIIFLIAQRINKI
jgi:2-polyprenyl-3-methyl-5-hydroxy-6-metoxy-1,4-benzoquinol methylase